MKKNLLFLLLLGCCFGMGSCSKQPSVQSRCTVDVKVDYPEFTKGYLRNVDGKRLDSLTVTNGLLSFERTDSLSMPYVAFIHLSNRNDSIDWMEMPLVVEGGKVNVEIGEYISTSGTPLNHQMQEFLNDLQATRSGIEGRNLSKEEISRTFSEFYKQQILSNKGNVLGEYIFKSYGIHLSDADLNQVKAQLGY